MERLDAKQREIAGWEREKRRPRGSLYPAYLVLIISLIYLVDEVASQIGMLMKTEIANDLFACFGDSSVGALEILGAIGLPVMTIFGNQAMGILSLCLLVPGFVLALLTLWRRTGGTGGIDLDTVTGCEWD